MKYDPFPKYSFLVKTICSVFKNLGKDFDYSEIKEIAYGLREPITVDEKIVSFLSMFMAINAVNKNKYSSMVDDCFFRCFLIEYAELFSKIINKEKTSKNTLTFASFLLIKAFENKENERLFGTLFIMSQKAIFRYCGKYYVYPPTFFSDWEPILKYGQEQYLAVILRTKIDCLERDNFSIPVRQFDIAKLKRAFDKNALRLAEATVSKISVFGSCAGDLYTSQSDVDLLISLDDGAKKRDGERIRSLIRDIVLKSANRTCDILFDDSIPPRVSGEINDCIVIWKK